MRTVRVRCPDCGPVTLPNEAITARACTSDGTFAFSFRCSACGKATCKRCDGETVNRLALVDVNIVRWQQPAELFEPHPAGLPFTPDDVLDFYMLLASADTLDVWGRAMKDLT